VPDFSEAVLANCSR